MKEVFFTEVAVPEKVQEVEGVAEAKIVSNTENNFETPAVFE